jgi:hypothetical protein
MLKNSLIYGMVIPLISDATLAQASSNNDLISMKFAARMSSNKTSCSRFTNSAYHGLTTSPNSLLLRGFSISGGGFV